MGQLYDAVSQIDRAIQDRNMDPMKTKGEISLKAGFFLAIVFPDTPDDPDKIARLKTAAQDVLGLTLNA